MPQEVENLKTSEDSATEPGESKDVGPAKAENKPRRFGVGKLSLGLFLVAVLVGILTVVVFQTGAVESYVRGKFTSKMDRSGISFKSEKFSLRTFPLRLELRNAEFSNKVTKEPLLSIRSADIELSFIDLFAFRTTRDISVDSVDINGIDVYLNFDEEGRSNFTGVKITEDDELVKVTYQAAQVSVKNGRFRIGDEVRDIGFDLKEISLALNPKKSQSAVTGIENDISLRTGKSSFRLADGSIDDISLLLEGVIGPDSIEIAKLNIESATTSTSLKGTLSGFESPDYSFEVDSNLDIGSLSRILSPGTPINGSGKLRGRVTGKGADFKFKGAAETESLFTDGFSLRSLDVTASYEGRSGDYLLNGGAIAEALTFGGVQIDLPRLSGMLKGNGSDFEWLGELQAVAVRTGAGTIGGLFLRDASLQRNDRGVTAKSDRVEFGRFVSDNLTINEIGATGFSLNNTQGFTDISVAGATASNLRTGDISLGGIRSGKISIRDDKTGLIIQSPQLSARKGSVGDLNLSELESDSVTVVNKEGKTSVRANSLSARNATIGPFSLDGVRVEEVEALDQPSGLVVYSRGLQTARIESDALSLGVVDVAGVRLRVFKGTVEFTTDNPIKAASVSLKSSDGSSNGSLSRVSAERLVYVVDPSGSYRATADVSIGGGNIGRLNLGAATAELEVSKDEVSVRNLNGDILGGKLQGTANFSIDENRNSNLNVSFSDLQASEIFTLFGGIAPPVTSSISGYGEFTFQGNDFTTSSGSLTAQSLINANVGFERIPLSGEVSVTAVNGLFAFQKARIETRYSTATVAGTLNIADLSANLKLFLGKRQGISEGNADEINAIVRPLISKTEIGQWAESNRFQTFGDLDFRGNLSGRLSNPELDGSVSISGISLRGKPLGSLSTGFAINPDALALRNGSIKESDGGNLSFSAMIPRYGENNIDVSARLSNVDFGSLIVLIPYDFPTAVQSIAANTSGSLDVTGLPGAMTGAADITATEVLFGMATFNRVQTTARLSESTINFDRLTLGFGQNSLEAPGSYDILSTDFNFDVSGKAMPLGALYAFIPANSPINEIGGTVDIKGYFKGRADDSSTFDVDFEGALLDVSLNRALIGNATIIGKSNETDFDFVVAPASGSPFPAVRGKLVLDNPNLPFNARLDFNKSSLEPIFNLFPLPNEEGVKGIVSGTVEIEGDLSSASGGFPVSKLKGTASIAQVDIQLPQTSISSSRPFSLALSNGLLTVGDRSGVAFTGGGSDLLVSGVKALDEISENNLSLRGRLNLGIINAFLANSFLSGIANVDIRITGPNADEILNGSASLERAALSTFVSTERITLDQLTGRINFTSNRVDINSVRGNLGGGKVSISGIATLLDDFRIERLILNISGEKVRVPFPKNFQTVGNANFRIDTERNGIALRTLISGRIVPQKASYETDIDLADVTGGRRESPISQSNPASSLGDVILDLSIEGRNALEVRNNLADLTASLSLRVTGDVGSPQISGRISSNSGLIFFRRDRYEIQRAELLFPPQTNADPILNLQAVAEIRGYQVIVALNGVISDAESLNLSVRSNPSLPQADVISLITTGSLANTESGIPTVAQSGISTAAEVLTNEIINKPVTRATDRLFGLNRFELDPIISGSRLNPTARLTVGRQINRDLAVTYSTNLSDTQNQVVAFEYRVSNRISFVAQYEQRELSNVTRQSNNFSFEVRLRKRF